MLRAFDKYVRHQILLYPPVGMTPIVSIRLPLFLRVADRYRRRLARSLSNETFDTYRLDLGVANANSMLVVLGGYFVPTGPNGVVTFQDKQRAGEALLSDFRWVSNDLDAVIAKVSPGTTFNVAPLSLRQVNFHRYSIGDLATLSATVRVNPRPANMRTFVKDFGAELQSKWHGIDVNFD